MLRKLVLAIALVPALACATRPAGTGPTPEAALTPGTVRAITPPADPLPSEEASAGVERFSFIVYGDTRGARDGPDKQRQHADVVESMVKSIVRLRSGPDPVRFVLQSGDAVYDGRDAEQWNVGFVGLVNRITTEGGVPYFLAPGNHDLTLADEVFIPGRMDALRNYLMAIDRLIPPEGATRRLSGYPTYAFGYGNTFVLAMDSNIADDVRQFAWAQGQLEGLDRTRYTHVAALFHHPPISSGRHGGLRVERPTEVVRELWMPLFRTHKVDLVFTGHEHLFEHWMESWRDADGVRRRMDLVVTGGGGAPLYYYTDEPDLRSYLRAGAADSLRVEHLVRPASQTDEAAYHYVIVHVNGPSAWYQVVSVGPGLRFAPNARARLVLGNAPITPDR